MVQDVLEVLDTECAGILAVGGNPIDPSDFSAQSLFDSYTEE